jgi:hypothetical protein
MTIPFVCDLAAIPAAERGAHQQVTRHLVSAATEIRESGEGFSLRLSADEYDAVTQFVARERLCCPFLKFVVVAAPERGNVELRITGPTGAREFIRAELHLPG